MNQTQIRKTEEADLKVVVEVHLKAFQGFFLSFLGSSFLLVLYRSILADPSEISFVAENKDHLAGFVVGTTQPSGLYGRLLKKHLWKFAWASIGAFLHKPTILPRLLRAFSMPNQDLPNPKCGTLMSIAVDPDCQGQGVGKMLVEAFLQEAAKRGVDSVNLTTDAKDNEATNKFYQSLGFQNFRTYTTPEGRAMNEYLYRFA